MVIKSDEHGEYDTDAGSKEPVTEEEMGYIPCNAVLKFTFERYGERRYCTAMAEENFIEDGSTFCKNHKGRENLMERHADQMKTGAYSKSHSHAFQNMEPHEAVLANDMYKSLLEESKYSWDEEVVELRVDASNSDFGGPEVDTIVMDHPVPTNEHKIRAKALWFAALDFVIMENIREEQFRVAMEEDLAVGEAEYEKETESGRIIKVKDEHHLNLPLSRIQKDYKEHMKFGGVAMDDDSEQASMGAREWVVKVEPDEETPAPEAQRHDTSPLDELEVPDDAAED
jgi:hypothetical protein